MSRSLICSSLVVLVLGLSITPQTATAAVWTPNNAKVILSTNFKFEIKEPLGVVNTFECVMIATAKTGENQAEFAFQSPAITFRRCVQLPAFTIKATEFTAAAVGASQANMKIPEKGFTITTEGCKIEFKAKEIGAANDYENGINGKTFPSIWSPPSATVSVTQNPANCFTTETSGTLRIPNMILQNDTNNEAIKP